MYLNLPPGAFPGTLGSAAACTAADGTSLPALVLSLTEGGSREEGYFLDEEGDALDRWLDLNA